MKKKLIAYLGQDILTKEEANKLTAINVAFGTYDRDGNLGGADHPVTKAIAKYKEYNPDLKIILSMVNKGADAFTRICSTPANIENCAEISAAFLEKYGYDGIDFDWEYPTVPSNFQDTCPEDRYRFTEFCRAIRKAVGPNKLVTIAAGADLYYTQSVELDKLSDILDYINLMTYDLKCGFHALAGHHTQLYSSTGDYFRNSCDQALELFHSCGVPKEKLLLGAAFYSRKWEGINPRNHGLLQISKTGGGYGPDFTGLDRDYINKNGFVRYWDDEAKAPWLYNETTGTFLSYDDEESMAYKADYVLEKGYGGIFYWEHRCDATGKLLNALYNKLK